MPGTIAGGISTTPGACVVASNVLTLTNAFGSGSYSTSGGAIQFTFSVGGTNPVSATDSGSYTVSTYYYTPGPPVV